MPICPIDAGRYGTEKMLRVFNEEARLQFMLDVEAAAARAQAILGLIPKEAAEEISSKANLRYVKVDRCREIEESIGHDVMALVKALTEVCGEKGRGWVHYGLTSNDVLDTATGMQVKEAIGVLRESLIKLLEALLRKAVEYRNLIMAGRTHGQHAGVITLGLKFAVWVREFHRHLDRLNEAESRAAVGKILGVVGTGAALGDQALKVQELALKELGLKPADMVTQVVQRDVHAELISVLANMASSLEKLGTEVRNLQRPEINELMEPFKEDKQVGSSAVPAKRNPVKSERVCSLARLVRAFTITAYENIPLWHERDLTNSANERFTIPFAFILLDEMVNTMTQIIEGLRVHPENAKRNLELTGGLILSERVATELAKRGLGRQESHELVRQCAMKVYRGEGSFKKALIANPTVSRLISEEELTKLLDYSTYLGVTQTLIDEAVEKTRKSLNL